MKKTLSLVLAVLMIVSAFIAVPVTVSAATGRDAAVAWANSQIGKALDFDGVPVEQKYQCVDLIYYYYKYLGVKQAGGNAVDYQYNALPLGWKRISVTSGFVPQPGDIAVWKANLSGVTTWAGHVGIVISADASTFYAINQNYNYQAYCSKNSFPVSYLHSVIRPDYSKIGESIVTSFYEYPSQYSVTETNAVLATQVKLDGVNNSKVSKVGIYLYDVNEKLIASKTETPFLEGESYFYTWYDVNSELNQILTKNTTYKYKFMVVINGTTYYSPMVSFTTGGGSTPKPDISISWSIYEDQYSINETNAVLGQYVTLTGATGKQVSKVGLNLYDENEKLIFSKTENASLGDENYLYIWYDINSELGITLTPGTTYKYKFMVVINGTTYYSPLEEFMTKGSSVKTYTITYNANGGSGAPAQQTKTHDIALTLSTTKPTRAGYNFKGWATSANGSVSYAPGAGFNVNADTTLYAVWEKATVSVTGVTLNKTTATLTEGETLTLAATVAPANATNKNVTWTSSDTSVTIVENGVVTAKKAGTATITVTTVDGSKTSSCVITVKAAYNPNALTFTVGTGKAVAGRTVEIGVAISNNPGIAGFSFKVGYDSSVMTLVGYECPGWEASSSSFDEDPTKNPVGFSWSRTKDYTANTSILTLTFEIKESAPEGEYSITLTSDDVVSNQAGEDIEYNLVGGKITVIDCTPGDSNGDGTVNSKDAVLLAQLLANWDVEIDINAADCNGDGAVNSKDAVLLAQYLANWDVTLG